MRLGKKAGMKETGREPVGKDCSLDICHALGTSWGFPGQKQFSLVGAKSVCREDKIRTRL